MINLWNLTRHKYRSIKEYINGLEPTVDWTFAQDRAFLRIKKEALSLVPENAVLKRIGYRYNFIPGIYDEVERMKVKQ